MPPVRIKPEWRMTSFHLTGDALWQRMERAAQKVQERLERTAATLEQAGVPYAVIGGHAVRAWVAQVDEAAVRTTRDVDILLRRSDWPAAAAAILTTRRDSNKLLSRDHVGIHIAAQTGISNREVYHYFNRSIAAP
jgi:uncharacterized protein YycO